MVLTPWGYSGTLKERKLRPGPGVPREEVVANQRERLFGAMVTSVCQRGYEATTLSDLVEISGVSSRTFYDLFPDKQACFLATLEAIIEAAIAYAAQSAGEAGGKEAWEDRAHQGFQAFAAMIVAQPAAARLALVDVYAAGSEALPPIERAVAGFEGLT